jgi:hypothetical protein
MNASFRPLNWTVWAGMAALLLGASVSGYPPSPHQTVFGLVRDEQGNPLNSDNAVVFLEVGGSVVAQGRIATTLDLGVNYRLMIPLDAGVTADKFKPTALLPAVPFRLRVKIGNASYLPIEMIGVSNLVTKAGGLSRVDLTLGEDSDGDGLPDAWERALIAAMGGKSNLADIRPGDDSDGDGLSNLAEYLAGTYAFDPKDGFSLSIVSVDAGRPMLEFTAIRGRSYTIQATEDMQNWTQVPFVLSTDPSNAPARPIYVSTDVRPIRALVAPGPENEARPRFFRLMLH